MGAQGYEHGHEHDGTDRGHGGGAVGGHAHGHSHLPPDGARGRLVAVLAVSVTILAVEVVGAVVSGSLALLADAGHVLTDVAGLGLAVAAATLARRPATDRRTWGFRRAEVLAAAAQAAVLLAVGVFVVVEALRRLVDPPAVDAPLMLAFGGVGLLGNLVGLALLVGRRGENLNTRAAFLEVLNDALGSVAVVLAALAVLAGGWLRADGAASLVIGLLILPRTWKLLRETVDVLLETTPKGVDLAEVRSHVLGLPHVLGVHDLHASTVATGLPVLSAHVVVDDACFHDGHVPRLLDEVQACLAGHFDVEHSTFQFESAAHADHEHAAHH
ncbi:cation diffusion facilitator family transporter [Kineosporia sp. A_224]|uniref:cation diffusion facilitator family transporter n=1 Tax=Kineosporia sp. A_224 TaxID=1962180 RepID=UPI000B4BCCD8|nr:cation diffusion facilitator family transporter [Kineosporia sp. A_224]